MWILSIFSATVFACSVNLWIAHIKFLDPKYLPILFPLFIVECCVFWYAYRVAPSYFYCWVGTVVFGAIVTSLIDIFYLKQHTFNINFVFGVVCILFGTLLIKYNQ
jgi:hypothetical protein